jgi:endo-1,4-beta-xylanase
MRRAVLFTLALLALGCPSAFGEDEKFLGNVFRGFLEPLNFSQYWNQVTPENAGKWESVEPGQDMMFWGMLDAIYEYALEHGFPFKMHTLVWGKQQPMWVEFLPPEEARQEVEEWFAAVAERYPRIALVDVVNEPLHAPPPYKGALGGDGETGWDWVITAFALARTYFPESKLLLNEYGIISSPENARRYVEIILLLKERGLIDGIGIQCHAFDMDTVTPETMREVLGILAATGLPIYVSELDITGDDETQLRRYQGKFPILWKHPGVAGVTLWGYIQGQMWMGDAYLLRTDGTERPALTWLMGYVRRDP